VRKAEACILCSLHTAVAACEKAGILCSLHMKKGQKIEESVSHSHFEAHM